MTDFFLGMIDISFGLKLSDGSRVRFGCLQL